MNERQRENQKAQRPGHGEGRAVSRRRSIAGAVVALLVPAVAGAVALASFDDREQQVDQVRAAVVNLDEAVTITDPETGEEQPVLAGRLLAGELTSNDDALLGWELTDADDAAAGLDDGTYEAAITIPQDFSAAATSISGDDPRQATIEVRTAEAGSPVAALVGRQVASAAAATVGGQLTEQYLGQVLLGFGGLETQLGTASQGAADLATGLGQLADGATGAADGATRLADGTNDLASGLDDLTAGVEGVADGADGLADGAGQLAGGLAQLRDRSSGLPQQTRSLADGAGQVSGGAAQVSQGLAGLQQACALPVTPTEIALCQGIGQLAPAAAQVATGAAGVATGTDALADGVPALASGIAQSAGGAAELADGADELASGAGRLASGADDAASGAGELASGAGELASGVDQLATGATDAQTGATRLSDGLGQGAAALPSYSDDQRERLADVVTRPVSSGDGTGLGAVSGSVVPLVAVLVLWLGALATFLVRRPLAARAATLAASARRLALQGWWPAALIGAGQVLVLAAVVAAFGLDVASPVPAVLVGLLAAAAFTALHQALVAVGGRFGQVLSLVLLVVQVASMGGLIPLATAPEAFQVLGGVLPLPLAVDALTTLVQGGGASVAGAVAGLVAWTLVPLLVSVWAAGREQRWTVASVRRSLVPVGT